MSQSIHVDIDRGVLAKSSLLELNKNNFKDIFFDSLLGRNEKILYNEIGQRDETDIYLSALYSIKMDKGVFVNKTYSNGTKIYIEIGSYIHVLDEFVFKDVLYACVIAKESKTLLVDEYSNSYDLSGVDHTFFFDTHSDLTRRDSGQAKIAYSSFVPFVPCDPSITKGYVIPGQETETYEHLQVLVVGSSSESCYAGITYIILAQLLTKRGHYGRIDLYDEHEVPSVTRIGSFVLNYYASNYHYGEEMLYDVVLDDSYDFLAYTGFEIPLGISAFVYDDAGRCHYVKPYTDVPVGVYGQGLVLSASNLIYQHPDYHVGNHVFHPQAISRQFLISTDPFLKISKIGKHWTTKYFFGEVPPNAYVIDQPFYTRTEKRLVDKDTYYSNNVKKKFDCNHGCVDCVSLGNLISLLGLDHYSYLQIRAMAHQCVPTKGIKTMMIKNYAIAAARRKTDLRIAISQISAKCSTSSARVHRVINSMDGCLIELLGDGVSYMSLSRQGSTSPSSFINRNRIMLIWHKVMMSVLGTYGDVLPSLSSGYSCGMYYDDPKELDQYQVYVTYNSLKEPPINWIKCNQVELFTFYVRATEKYLFKFH